MKRSRFAAVLVVAVISFVALGSQSQPTRVTIVPPSASLQEAINAAPEGAVIQLQAREYAENITIDKSITLRGFSHAPDRVILGPESGGPVVTIRGDENSRIVLEGFTVQGAKGYFPDGVFCQRIGFVRLRSLIVRGCWGSGISAYGGGQLEIWDCQLRENNAYGLTVASEDTVVTGSGNRFTGNGTALGCYAPPELRAPLAEQTELETVRVPEHYKSVQAAVDAVLPGGTVEISAGEFPEGITLWKDVTLRGRGETETTLTPLPKRAVGLSILHAANSVSLEDLTIASSGASPIEASVDLHLSSVALVGARGVYHTPFLSLLPGGRLVVRDSRFEGIGGAAVRADEGTEIDLLRCAFEENSIDLHTHGTAHIADCRFIGTREIAIHAEKGELEVDRSVFRETHDGIGVGYVQAAVRECTFAQMADTGLTATLTSDVLVQDCTFNGGAYGVVAAHETVATLEHCVLTGATAAAVEVTGTGQLLIRDCEIADNDGLGIYVFERGSCTVVDSTIRTNGYNTWDAWWNELFDGPGVRVSWNGSLRMENVTVASNAGSGVECLTGLVDSPLDRVEPENEPVSVELIGCRFDGNNGPGLSVFDAREIQVVECEFARNTFGVLLMSVASVMLEGSSVTANTIGIYGQGNSELVVHSSTVERSSHAGLMLSEWATGIVTGTSFTDNGIGILLTEQSGLLLTDCEILRSMTYGISLACTKCWPPGIDYDPAWDFVGTLAGEGNWIPDFDEPEANQGGALCPDDRDRGGITERDDST